MRKELIKRYVFDIAVYTLDALDNLTHITNIENGWDESKYIRFSPINIDSWQIVIPTDEENIVFRREEKGSNYFKAVLTADEMKVGIDMFVSVKSLTALIDQDIQFYIEGVASKEQHSPEEFEKWHKYIKSRLVEQLSKLKKISCNKKLIATYENKTNELLKK